MNLAEAKLNTKDLLAGLQMLLDASAGIKEADFEALQNKKNALESSLVVLKKKVIDESNAADLKIANAQAAAKEKQDLLAANIATAEQQLANIQTQAKVSRETIQNELREYRAREIAAKSAELSRLNNEVSLRQRVLEDINSQIEIGRKRFA